jgi:hypothetical protein
MCINDQQKHLMSFTTYFCRYIFTNMFRPIIRSASSVRYFKYKNTIIIKLSESLHTLKLQLYSLIKEITLIMPAGLLAETCWWRYYTKTTLIKLKCIFLFVNTLYMGHAAGGAVGWGTALQARRSRVRFPMVSLKFFIDIILPTPLWPWGWLSL